MPSPPFYPCSLICKSGTFSYADNIYPFIDTADVPEATTYHGQYLFYYPDDTNFCVAAPAYTTVVPHFNIGLGWVTDMTSYKLGIGKTYYTHADGDPTYETDRLFYYNIHGSHCGNAITLATENTAPSPTSFSIYPNPASTELTIKTTATGLNTMVLQNSVGQVLKTVRTAMQEQNIDINNLPSGLYNVSVTVGDGTRYTQKFVVIH